MNEDESQVSKNAVGAMTGLGKDEWSKCKSDMQEMEPVEKNVVKGRYNLSFNQPPISFASTTRH